MDKPVLTGAHALVAARQLLHMADCNPREVDFFNGFDFTAVSTDEMKELRNLICGVLSLRDRRTWSGNGLRTTVNNRNIYLGRCSRNGKPVATGVAKSTRNSNKCGCQAKFSLCPQFGLTYTGDHSELCKPKLGVDFNRNGYVMRNLQSEEWKASGSGGLNHENILNQSVNSICDNPGRIEEMCKNELEKILPVIIQHEKYRMMLFQVIEEIQKMQSDDAIITAQARQLALGYGNSNSNSSSSSSSSSISCSVSATPLESANDIFDRGKKRKMEGGAKTKTKK